MQKILNGGFGFSAAGNNTFVEWPYENPPQFFPFQFEKFDRRKCWQYMVDHWDLPFYCSLVYVFVIFSLQRWMRERKPFNLRSSLALWNVGLAVFSITGFWRISPEFISIITGSNGFHRSVCVRDSLNEPALFWSLLFAWSKYIELGDTLFVVLRKQNLILLHWYHHVLTMIVTWQILPLSEPICRWYGVMNYGVHSLMYPYFAIRALGYKIPRKLAFAITTLQLSQMMVGLGINVYSVAVLGLGGECARETSSIKWSVITYASFAYLFGNFLYKTYFGTKTKKL